MSWLHTLGVEDHRLGGIAVEDIRAQLAHANWSIGRRSGNPTGATIHYEGPAFALFGNVAAERRQIAYDAQYHLAKVWGYTSSGQPIYGNGLMYHLNVLSDGAILLSRDLDEHLWHCGNQIGNTQHLAIHLVLGEGQTPTTIQWERLTRLCDTLKDVYGWQSRQAIVGHNEWPRITGWSLPSPVYRVLKSQSACPGSIVHRLLAHYRTASRAKAPLTTWQATQHMRLRQAPNLNGKVVRVLPKGSIVEVDLVKTDGDAEPVYGDKRWLHLASGEGFTWAGGYKQL